MTYIKKNFLWVVGSIVGLMVVAAIAIWQFYLFATFRDTRGVVDLGGGGIGHFWWAIVMAVLACVVGFFVFSAFVQHDADDELHITS